MGNFYVYSSEVMAGHLRVWSVSLCFVGFSLGGVFINFISMFNSHYQMYLALCMGFHTLPYVGVFWLVESPFFHYKNKNIAGLYASLRLICQVNFCGQTLKQKIMEIQTRLRYGKSNIYNPIYISSLEKSAGQQNYLLDSKEKPKMLEEILDTYL